MLALGFLWGTYPVAFDSLIRDLLPLLKHLSWRDGHHIWGNLLHCQVANSCRLTFAATHLLEPVSYNLGCWYWFHSQGAPEPTSAPLLTRWPLKQLETAIWSVWMLGTNSHKSQSHTRKVRRTGGNQSMTHPRGPAVTWHYMTVFIDKWRSRVF